jgi:hypothetical protein
MPIGAGRKQSSRTQEPSNRNQAKMEISPIIGVRNEPAIRPKETFLGLPGVFEVEYSSRTGDETYSPSNSKAASGYEDDEDEDEEDVYEHLEDDEEPRPKVHVARDGQDRPVSYFA